MSIPPPAGIYVPVPTFFVPKSAASYNPTAAPLDLDTQVAHALYLAKAGIRGLVLLGSTGESVHLTNAERRQVLSAVRGALDQHGFKNYPLMAGTATQNIEDTLSLLREAHDARIGWGLVLAPGYFGASADQEGLIQWFRAVADRSPIPILVYHYPAVSNNVRLLPSTLATLSQHPNIVGCKLSHGDVSHHAQVASHPDVNHAWFYVFTGLGQQLLPVLSVGCMGAIDGLAGFFPKTMVRLYALSSTEQPLSGDDIRQRRLLQYRVSAAEELVVQQGVPGIKEAISRLRGFGDVEGTRLPLQRGMSAGEWDKWASVLKALEETEDSL